jgi:asparagine synthase (glutamine-hydrolysing)
MLWTTPESLQEKLPLVHRAGDMAITADARLDNRDELIQTLGLTGRPPVEIADTS